MKKAALLVLVVLLTAGITSIVWSLHLRRVVKSLTLSMFHHDILAQLTVLKKLETKEFKDWFDETERDLALNTVSLFGVLEGATPEEKTESLKCIQAIKRHTFRDTNEFTSAAIELLKTHPEPARP